MGLGSQLAARAAVISVLAAVVSSCSSASEPREAPITTGGVSATTSVSGKKAATTLVTDSFALTVGGAQGAVIVATEVADAPPPLPSFLSIESPGAKLVLSDGGQPSQPVTLSFGFEGKRVPPVTEDVVPVVVAVSEGTSQPEVLRSQWNPTTKTLRAMTEHLSGFFPALVDLKAVGDMFATAVNGYLGIADAKPECVGQPLTVGDVTYRAEPESVPAAWPCLAADGDTIRVDLHSNSPNGWLVRSAPVTKDVSVDLQPDVNNLVSQAAYNTIFAASVGDGTFLLPGGTTHLRFAKDTPPTLVGLRADPGVTLINGFSVGLNTLFPNSKVLAIPGMVDCVKPVVSDLTEHDTTTTMVGANTRSLIDCLTGTAEVLSTKPAGGSPVPLENIAAKSLGAILSLGPSLANQLAATLGGLAGELTGANTQTINIVADHSEPTSSVPATLNLSTKLTDNGAGLELGPNHFQISRRYTDKGRHYADVNYKWTINRPAGSNLGYCKGHVVITNAAGGIVDEFHGTGFNACYGGGAFATNLKLFDPGTYTVTADIEMERGPTLHGVQEFILSP